jgi:hypothetical protein
MMTDTRRLRAGYVTVAMAMPDEMATILRVQALLHHQSIGDYVTSLLPREVLAGMVIAKATTPVAEPTAKAPGKAREATGATKAATHTDEARADLWLLLESTREAEGWTDGTIAERLGIAARNVSQWRKAGMVTSTKVEAVTKLLSRHKAKP